MSRTLHAAVLPVLLTLAACSHHPATHADPVAVVAAARARTLPTALQARFTIHFHRGESSFSTGGALVLHPPDQLRLEIHSPLGTPVLVLASDGRALNVFDASHKAFYKGDDAAAALAELTGGTVGLPDLIRLLSGTLPLPDAAISSSEDAGDGVALSMSPAAGVLLSAVLDPKTDLMQSLSVARGTDPPLVEVLFGKGKREGDTFYPSSLDLAIPGLDLNASLDFSSWTALAQVPSVFTLTSPPDFAQKDLVEALKAAAHPPP